MPALLLQSEAGGMLANGFTVLCLLSSGSGVERSSGSLPGRPNVVSGVAGTCPRATPVSRRSAVGMAHKRSIRLQCMMSSPTVSLVLFQPICSDSIRAPWHFVDARAYAITAVSARDVAMETPMSSKQSREQVSKRLDPDVLEVVQHGQEQPGKPRRVTGSSAAKRRTTRDRRTAPGNGTSFSAVAPSERPLFDAHPSNFFESGIAPTPAKMAT